MNHKQKFLCWLSLIALCTTGVIFRREFMMFVDEDRSPKYPSHYFTAAREAELRGISDLILKSRDISEIRLSLILGIFPSVRIKGSMSKEDETRVVHTLRNNCLEYLRVEHDLRVVRYGFYSNRTWYYYFYGDNSTPVAKKCKPETIKQLGRQWVFGEW